MANTRGLSSGILLGGQILFIILFGVMVEYNPDHTGPSASSDLSHKNDEDQALYPVFQDVHVMILLGIGFLMTFLKRHGFCSVGFNFMLTCYIIQWALLVNGWFTMWAEGTSKIPLDLESFLHADFAVATVLISFGGILGVASPSQLIVMGTLEVVFYNFSIHITNGFKLTDVGGSIVIHTFGAYFGLAVSFVLGKFSPYKSDKEGSVYHSDLFAMIGTIFLWLFWPSFNAGPAVGNERQRAIINTIMSLSACTTVTFAMSAIVNKENKLDMVHIQNAAIAGGVAMGSSADLLVQPWAALLIGSIGAVVSVVGYAYVQPALEKAIGLHDTCGIHNLHGMPGIVGAVLSAIFIAFANEDYYGSVSWAALIKRGDASSQASYQIYSLLVSLILALVSGAFTGLFMSLPIWDRLNTHELFEDAVFWEVEENEEKSEELQLHTTSA